MKKEKDIVIAGVIGWVAGPFTFVYLGKKTYLRAFIELILIVAIIYFTHYMVAAVFVFLYAMLGAIGAKNYNLALKYENSQNK